MTTLNRNILILLNQTIDEVQSTNTENKQKLLINQVTKKLIQQGYGAEALTYLSGKTFVRVSEKKLNKLLGEYVINQ